jgi:hypothetical protein
VNTSVFTSGSCMNRKEGEVGGYARKRHRERERERRRDLD